MTRARNTQAEGAGAGVLPMPAADTTEPLSPAALAQTVLREEARRQSEAQDRAAEVLIDESDLPGVDGERLSLREILARGGKPTLGLLLALNFLDEFDKAAFGVLAPDIQESLGLSVLGIALVGSLGGFLVALAAIPVGWIGDRMNRTRLIAAFSGVWAVFGLLTGMVTAVWQLLVVRVFAGLGKVQEGPLHKSLLADAYPVEGRARVFALHDAANPLGQFAAPITVGALAAVAGWRTAFVIMALPAAAAAVGALALREPRRGTNEIRTILGEDQVEATQAEDEQSLRLISFSVVWQRLKKIQTYRYALLTFGALGFVFFGAAIFFNVILEDSYGLDAGARGVVGTIVAIGGVAGSLAGGIIGDRLFSRSPRRVLEVAGLGLGLVGIGYPIAVNMPTVAGYVVVSLITTALVSAATAPIVAVFAAIIPPRLRSLGLALIGVYLALIGGIGGAIVAGLLATEFGPRAAVTLLMPPTAIIGGALLLYGARFVASDMAAVVADLRDEQRRRESPGDAGLALEVSHVDFSYDRVQTLFDVNLEIRRGEVLALLGTNGAGKSTLLKVISGLETPERGAVRCFGDNITYADPAMRVGLGVVQVPGGKAVFPTLTVRENLQAGAFSFRRDSDMVAERLAEVVALFPVLEQRFDQAAGTLSGGEQQMLAIAKGLMLHPRVLLIDELSLGLAPVVVEELLRVVGQLKERGMTIVIVEQSVNVALALADRAVFMEKGQVRFEGPASELLERGDLLRAVFLGGAAGEPEEGSGR